MRFFTPRLVVIGVGVFGLPILLLGEPLDAGEPSEVCVSADINIINVSAGSCLGNPQINSMLQAPVIQKSGQLVPLKLTPPDSITTKIPVETCADYIRKMKEGWYALTQRDMDRESMFTARCGLLTALARARTPRFSYISGKKGLKNLDWLPASLLPQMGEASASYAEAPSDRDAQNRSVAEMVAAGECTVRQATPGYLQLIYNMNDISIRELARADFNGDGYEDMLVILSSKLKGGTAGFSEVQGLTRQSPRGLLKSFVLEIQ